jgi:hypothetical protein
MHPSTRAVKTTDRSSHYRVRSPLFVGLDAQSSLVPHLFERSREERTRRVSSTCLFSDRMGKIWVRSLAGAFLPRVSVASSRSKRKQSKQSAEHFCRVEAVV